MQPQLHCLHKILYRLTDYTVSPNNKQLNNILIIFFHRHYSPLWALACRTMNFDFFLSATNSLHLLTPSTWISLSTSSFHLFLGLLLLFVPPSSQVKIFLGILSSSILSRWPNQLIFCPFIHFTIFSPLIICSSSRFVLLFHSPCEFVTVIANSVAAQFKVRAGLIIFERRVP